MQYLLYVRNCSENFTHITTLYKLLRHGEVKNNPPEATWLVSGSAELWTQAGWSQSPCSQTPVLHASEKRVSLESGRTGFEPRLLAVTLGESLILSQLLFLLWKIMIWIPGVRIISYACQSVNILISPTQLTFSPICFGRIMTVNGCVIPLKKEVTFCCLKNYAEFSYRFFLNYFLIKKFFSHYKSNTYLF